MTKRSVTKWFAVVALASGCELADADKNVHAPQQPQPAPAPAPKQVEPTPQPAPQPTPGMSASQPRTLRNGRPACGNVASRSPAPADCTPKGTP